MAHKPHHSVPQEQKIGEETLTGLVRLLALQAAREWADASCSPSSDQTSQLSTSKKKASPDVR
jgi:hypothetical protein